MKIGLNKVTDQAALMKLENYGFSPTDLNRCVQDGFTYQDVLLNVESLLNNNLTSYDQVRDTFFDEMYPILLADNPPNYFVAKVASEIEDSELEFLWRPYLPIGEYAILMAPSGTGKSFFCCGVAAAISSGHPLPGNEDYSSSAHNVLFISDEDPGYIIKQRILASGGDPDRIFIIDQEGSDGLNISTNYEAFRNTVRMYSPKLLILDPWYAFIDSDIDINRINSVRPFLKRIAVLAKEMECSIILVSHVGKRTPAVSINDSALGSVSVPGTSRSALCIIFDEEDEDGRILVHTKTNYERYGQSLKFRIEDGAIKWVGSSPIDHQTLEEAAKRKKTAGEVAKEHADKSEINLKLYQALLDAVSEDDIVRFTYEDFKAKYGTHIFGLMQPKKALEAVSELLTMNGYELRAGIPVRNGNVTGKGFSLCVIQSKSVDTS